MSKLDILSLYIEYVVETKYYLFNVDLIPIMGKVLPMNHVWRNDLAKQPGVVKLNVLGVIMIPVTMYCPVMSFEEFYNKTRN